MPHRVGLARYEGFIHAWVLDLPGCATGAPGEGELAAALDLSAAEHRAWLAAHGLHTHVQPFEVVEEIDARTLDATGGEFCFAADREALAQPEFDALLRTVAWATDELVAAASRIPPEVLDWTPPGSVLERPDPWAPDVRTAREILRHALQLEVYYRGGLSDGPAPGIFEEVEDPLTEAARTERALRAAFARGGGSYRVMRPGRDAAEEWTIRKAVRRLVAHHRAHAAEIEQRRIWVLLGVPVVERA